MCTAKTCSPLPPIPCTSAVLPGPCRLEGEAPRAAADRQLCRKTPLGAARRQRPRRSPSLVQAIEPLPSNGTGHELRKPHPVPQSGRSAGAVEGIPESTLAAARQHLTACMATILASKFDRETPNTIEQVLCHDYNNIVNQLQHSTHAYIIITTTTSA